MAKFFLTNKAVEDLSGIWNYTYENWSEQQADKYYELLIDTCKRIAEKPSIGKHYDQIDKNILGYRTNQHIIFYRIIAPEEIEVIRILHGRMDLKNRIQK
jgi:toxin ParE1/3/4